MNDTDTSAVKMTDNLKEYQEQYDPNKEFVPVFNTGAKLAEEEEAEQEMVGLSPRTARAVKHEQLKIKQALEQRKQKRMSKTATPSNDLPDNLNLPALN